MGNASANVSSIGTELTVSKGFSGSLESATRRLNVNPFYVALASSKMNGPHRSRHTPCAVAPAHGVCLLLWSAHAFHHDPRPHQQAGPADQRLQGRRRIRCDGQYGDN